MPTDVELIDLIKSTFNYRTDLEVAGFLGVCKDTISAIRNNRTVMGESLRFTILDKWKALDRVAYRKAEDFVLRARDVAAWRKLQSLNSESNTFFSTKMLVAKILDARRAQQDRWALNEVEHGPPVSEDAELLDQYKSYKKFSTDDELARAIGIKRNSVSMVRHGRSRLGPLPRLRIYRDAYGEDTSELEAALESSEALLTLIKRSGTVQTRQP